MEDWDGPDVGAPPRKGSIAPWLMWVSAVVDGGGVLLVTDIDARCCRPGRRSPH